MLMNTEMYERSSCFDLSSVTHQELLMDHPYDSFSQTHVSNFHQPPNFIYPCLKFPPTSQFLLHGIIGKWRDKGTKHFATEKRRRQQLNGKFDTLKNLINNPNKADRASVVREAIRYINELKRTMDELKILVERKRCNRGRKNHKTEKESTLDVESNYTRPNGGGGGDQTQNQHTYNGNSTSTLRSSGFRRSPRT